jgi:hypothetical protein
MATRPGGLLILRMPKMQPAPRRLADPLKPRRHRLSASSKTKHSFCSQVEVCHGIQLLARMGQL